MAVQGSGGGSGGGWRLNSAVRTLQEMLSGRRRPGTATEDQGAAPAEQSGPAAGVAAVDGAGDAQGAFRAAATGELPVWIKVVRDRMRDGYSAGADLSPSGSMLQSLVPEKVCGVSWGATVADMPSSDQRIGEGELLDYLAVRAGGALVTFLRGPDGALYADHDPATGAAAEVYTRLEPQLVQHLSGTIAGFAHQLRDAGAELARLEPDLPKRLAAWREDVKDAIEAGQEPALPAITDSTGLALRLDRAQKHAARVMKQLEAAS